MNLFNQRHHSSKVTSQQCWLQRPWESGTKWYRRWKPLKTERSSVETWTPPLLHYPVPSEVVHSINMVDNMKKHEKQLLTDKNVQLTINQQKILNVILALQQLAVTLNNTVHYE